MFDKVEEYIQEIKSVQANTADQLEQFRLKFISRKSVVSDLFNEFKNIPNEKKKEFGVKLNELRNSRKSGLMSWWRNLKKDKALINRIM